MVKSIGLGCFGRLRGAMNAVGGETRDQGGRRVFSEIHSGVTRRKSFRTLVPPGGRGCLVVPMMAETVAADCAEGTAFRCSSAVQLRAIVAAKVASAAPGNMVHVTLGAVQQRGEFMSLER